MVVDDRFVTYGTEDVEVIESPLNAALAGRIGPAENIVQTPMVELWQKQLT